jgi:hypothetical protein
MAVSYYLVQIARMRVYLCVRGRCLQSFCAVRHWSRTIPTLSLLAAVVVDYKSTLQNF